MTERGARMTCGQLDAKRLSRARLEVPRLNDPEQPRFQTRGHVRRQELKADSRMCELARERGIGRERRHQDDASVADVIEDASEHAGAQDVPGAAAVGHAPEQARTTHLLVTKIRRHADALVTRRFEAKLRYRARHLAATPASRRSAVAQSSASSMLKPYGGGMWYAVTLSPYRLGSTGSKSTAVRNR